MDVIYTVYNEFPDNQLEDSEPYPNDYIPKRLRTKIEFKKHYDRLIENKLTYAEFCEAEFIVDETPCKNYEELNHHKLKRFEELADKFDNVCYLDFDVIVNDAPNIFTKFDMSKINAFSINTGDMIPTGDHYDYKSKLFHKQEMLDDYTTDLIFNTGILVGGSEVIKKINYMNNLDNLKQLTSELELPFVSNNEVYFTYLIEKNNIPYARLPDDWHSFKYKPSANLVHPILKDFNKIWRNLI
mgnify:CR=1 FL=1